MDPFQLSPEDTREVGGLVPHRVLVDRRKFVEGLERQVFREILDHPEHSFVEGGIDLAGVLNVLEGREIRGGNRKSRMKQSDAKVDAMRKENRGSGPIKREGKIIAIKPNLCSISEHIVLHELLVGRQGEVRAWTQLFF